jgi:hypothetical protein
MPETDPSPPPYVAPSPYVAPPPYVAPSPYVAPPPYGAPPYGAPPSYGYPYGPPPAPAPPQPPPKRSRRAAVIGITLGVAVVTAMVVAALLGTKPPAPVPTQDRFSIPSTPPDTLAGQPATPEGLQQNTAWNQVVQKVASAAQVSFGSVYGPYPPTTFPTTDTFLAIGAQVDQPQSSDGLYNEVSTELHQAASSFPGSQVTMAAQVPSVLGGQIVCGSVATPRFEVGECLWTSPTILVTVATFADNGQTRTLTEHVVRDLHAQNPSG